MKTSVVFREAKKHLIRSEAEIGRVTGTMLICWAIDRVPARLQERDDARAIIKDRLKGHSVLDQWLQANGVKNRDITFDRVQAHRHAWLDLLIAEFEAKGD